MRFAAKIKSEPGWRVALAKEDGGFSFIEIEEWGIPFSGNNGAQLIPLSPLDGTDIRERKNFLMLLDPNFEYDDNVILSKAKGFARRA